MPGAERAHEARKNFIWAYAEFAARCGATNIGMECLSIDSIWVDDNLFIRHACAQHIAPLNF